MSEFLKNAILLGAVATALMDIFCMLRERLFGVAMPNYAPVGRWVAHLLRGRFFHHPITATPMVQGELAIGWLTHYAVGIAFAAILLVIAGPDWLRHPAIIPALGVGLASVAAPFLVMQPGMGFGIAASKTPDPRTGRMRSLTLHAVFGMSLYLAGWILRAFG